MFIDKLALDIWYDCVIKKEQHLEIGVFNIENASDTLVKGVRPVLEGFVTIHQGTYEQEVPILVLQADGLDVLLKRTRVKCNKASRTGCPLELRGHTRYIAYGLPIANIV